MRTSPMESVLCKDGVQRWCAAAQAVQRAALAMLLPNVCQCVCCLRCRYSTKHNRSFHFPLDSPYIHVVVL